MIAKEILCFIPLSSEIGIFLERSGASVLSQKLIVGPLTTLALPLPMGERISILGREAGNVAFFQTAVLGDLHLNRLGAIDCTVTGIKGDGNCTLIVDINRGGPVGSNKDRVFIFRIVCNPAVCFVGVNISKTDQRLSQRFRIDKRILIRNAIFLNGFRGIIAIVAAFVSKIQVDVIWNFVRIVCINPLGNECKVVDAIFIALSIFESIFTNSEREPVLIHRAIRVALELPPLEYIAFPRGHRTTIIAYCKVFSCRPASIFRLGAITFTLKFSSIVMLKRRNGDTNPDILRIFEVEAIKTTITWQLKRPNAFLIRRLL